MNGGRAWWRDGGGEESLGLHSRVLGLPMHVGLGVVPGDGEWLRAREIDCE